MSWTDSNLSLARIWEPNTDDEDSSGSTLVQQSPETASPSESFGSTIVQPQLPQKESAAAKETSARQSVDFSLHIDPFSRARAEHTSWNTPGETASPETLDAPIHFPMSGEVIGGFRIVSELGRGAFGRVYLAEQAELADRPVALKVTRPVGAEPQALARLQHTHIVPIHSVLDDPESGLRLMCMPYVGGANLAQVLQQTGARLPSQATGQSLVEALDVVGEKSLASINPSVRKSLHSLSGRPTRLGRAVTRDLGSPSRVRSRWGRYLKRLPSLSASQLPLQRPLDDDEPARRFLRNATYVQAAAWIAARLAEALEHAHERGILHRDLKPSNILIAADGTPMLLDFNLSADRNRIEHGAGDRAMLGGTLPYMAPEHLDAFRPGSSTPPEAVDERSDVYSLGLILFEMVAGHHPFQDPPAGMPLLDALKVLIKERRQGAPSARESNPQVPWSLDSILQKCLAPDPGNRYVRAGDLAEDLRRFLDDRPLKFAPETSPRECVAKWARRNPWACSLSTIGMASVTLVGLLGAGLWVVCDRLTTTSATLRREALAETFDKCQLLLNTTTGPDEHLDRGLSLARRALAAYGVDQADGESWLRSSSMQRLPKAEQREVRQELSEITQLLARGLVAKGTKQKSPEALHEALVEAVQWLDRAESFDPSPPAILFSDRAIYEEQLGRRDRAEADRKHAAGIPLRDARDYYLEGTARLAREELDRAEVALSQAVALEPRRFWGWFALGLCHYKQGRFTEAAGDFSSCTLLSPEFAWPHLNRGLSLAAAGRLVEAKTEYDRALTANPNFVEALVDRALTCLQQGDAGQALLDLERAIQLGRHDATILAARAESLSRLGRRDEAAEAFEDALKQSPDDPVVRVARGFFRLNHDPSGAREDFRLVRRQNPNDTRALLGLAYSLREDDPRAALARLDEALRIDPGLADARELRALVRARLGNPGAEADVDALLSVPTSRRVYNAACVMAILARNSAEPHPGNRALVLLRRAFEMGFPTSEAANDPDLDSLRDRPEFQAILNSSQNQ